MDSMDQVGQTKWSELGNLTRLDRPNGWSGNIKGNFFAPGAQSEEPEGDQDSPLHWYAAKAGTFDEGIS